MSREVLAIPALWLGIGFLGQLLFSMRFVVQWVATERQGRSVVPEAFWYFSVAGGATLLLYAIYRRDPVFMLGQAAGLVVYLRNLYFVRRERRRLREELPRRPVNTSR